METGEASVCSECGAGCIAPLKTVTLSKQFFFPGEGLSQMRIAQAQYPMKELSLLRIFLNTTYNM